MDNNNLAGYCVLSIFCCFFIIFIIAMSVQYFFAFNALSRGDYGAAYSIMAPRPVYASSPVFTIR